MKSFENDGAEKKKNKDIRRFKSKLDNNGEYVYEDTDAGYTAINYAFILELMANVRLDLTASLSEAFSESARKQLDNARLVRKDIIDYFGAEERKNDKTRPGDDFGPDWVFATLGEAYFGLGDFKSAGTFYKWYTQENEKQKKPGRWQIDTTAKQLTALAQVLIQLADFKSKQSGQGNRKEIYNTDTINKAACECLSILYSSCMKHVKATKSNDELPDIALRGKVGFALSGGGFRAALFHIGVFARLAELNVLRHIEVLSCVSGGSIVGAYYYLLLKQRLEEKDDQLDRDDYLKIVKDMSLKFVAAVQQNIRVKILSDWNKNFRIFSDKDYTRTNYLGELYEDILYRELVKNAEEDLLMHNLRIKPGGNEQFDIRMENWRRKNKIPMLVLNATSFNTGHNWQFTASWMGEPPGSIQQKVDSKPRLRRMYYKDAPEKYRNKIRLGMAVGASSCVPALFEPLLLRGLYPNLDLMLADGGVQDNQGVSSLLEQECKVMIVSDSSGQLPNETTLGTGPFNSFFRSDMVLQEKVREHQMTDLFKRRESSQLTGLFYMHLKKDLHANPVKWKYSKEPTRKIWLKQGFTGNVNQTSYGILKEVQEQVANLRTDLDAFTDTEAFALMYSGYCQADTECRSDAFRVLFKSDTDKYMEQAEEQSDDPLAGRTESRPAGETKEKFAEQPDHQATSTPDEPKTLGTLREKWNFLKIKKWMTEIEPSENLINKLKLGKSTFFKIFQIDKKLRSTILLTVLSLTLIPLLVFLSLTVAIVYGLVYYCWNETLTIGVTIKAIGLTLLIYLVIVVISYVSARLLHYNNSPLRTLFYYMAAAFFARLSKKYLSKYNQQYLDWGKIENLDK